jgi:glutathione S-transferase
MNEASPLQLFEFPCTRSARCRWALQEIGAPFSSVVVDLRSGANRQPEYLKVHPHGKVPALIDGDLVLFESVAICLHLAHRFPEAHLLPAPGSAARSVHDQWLMFCTNELEQPLWRIRRHQSLYPVDKRLPAEIELARVDFLAASEVLDRALEGRSFVAGDGLTVADIVIGYTLSWACWYDLLEGRRHLRGYLDGLKQRPAFPEELRKG